MPRRGAYLNIFGLIFSASISTEGLAQVNAASIVYIECTKDDGAILQGTGTIVSEDGKVLTAKHVAPAGSKCKGVRGTGATTPTRRLVNRGTSSAFDASLLQFVPDPNEVFEFVRYLPLSPLQGRGIAAYGFPDDGIGQISIRRGIISTTIPNSGGIIQTDALTASGMSGGPVFLSETGSLIGIIAGANFSPTTASPTYYGVLAAEIIANEFALHMANTNPPAETIEAERSDTDCTDVPFRDASTQPPTTTTIRVCK